MSEVVVGLDRASKRFLLEPSPDRSLAEILVRPFRRAQSREYSWPLRDVSFELEKGHSLGIIGENGTGKSTILKLIAGILEPTSGTVYTNGRISALLELGASFHPELTGRENVFLAGAIAGVSKTEMVRRVDDVAAFADIGPYFDVAVKHYSSGMYVRLGFAVAAHLQPDILLIDEVLAVGDEAFRHKCLHTIHEMQRRGVTIVLVSHALSQVEELCDTALWLHDGYVRSIGDPKAVIGDYQATVSAGEQQAQVAEWAELPTAVPAESNGQEPSRRYERGARSPEERRWGDHAIVIKNVCLLDAEGRQVETLESGSQARIEIDYEINECVEHPPVFGIAVYRSDEVLCFGTNTQIEKGQLSVGQLAQAHAVVVDIPTLQLLQGSYSLDVAIHGPDDRVTHDYIRAALLFSMTNAKGDRGISRQPVRWSIKSLKRELP